MNVNERLISKWIENIEHDLDCWSGRALQLLQVSADLATRKLEDDQSLTVAMILEYANFENLWCHYDRSKEELSELNFYLENIPGFYPFGPSDRLVGAEIQHDYIFEKLKETFPGRTDSLNRLVRINSFVAQDFVGIDGYPKYDYKLMACALDFARRKIENGANFTVDMIINEVDFEKLAAIYRIEEKNPRSLAADYFFHIPGAGVESLLGETRRLHAYACLRLRDYLENVMTTVE